MKKLIYKVEGYEDVYDPATEGVEKRLSLAEVEVCSPTAEDIARAAEIAYNGEYAIEDDGQPVPEDPQDGSVWDELDAAYREGVDGV